MFASSLNGMFVERAIRKTFQLESSFQVLLYMKYGQAENFFPTKRGPFEQNINVFY